jgi:hypothetical protein
VAGKWVLIAVLMSLLDRAGITTGPSGKKAGKSQPASSLRFLASPCWGWLASGWSEKWNTIFARAGKIETVLHLVSATFFYIRMLGFTLGSTLGFTLGFYKLRKLFLGKKDDAVFFL